jgi:hypothetical protein
MFVLSKIFLVVYYPIPLKYLSQAKLNGNWDKSRANICHQVVAWVPDVFCNFYLVKNCRIENNSTTTNAREQIITDWESLEFFNVCLTKFKNNQILLMKINH